MTGMRQGEMLRRIEAERALKLRGKQDLIPQRKTGSHGCACGKIISANKLQCGACASAAN